MPFWHGGQPFLMAVVVLMMLAVVMMMALCLILPVALIESAAGSGKMYFVAQTMKLD